MQGQNYKGPKSDASQLLQQLTRMNLSNIGTGIKEEEEKEVRAPTILNPNPSPSNISLGPNQIVPLTSTTGALVPVNIGTGPAISPPATTVKEVKQSNETLSLQNFFIYGDYNTVESSQTYYWNIITELLDKVKNSIILKSIEENNFFE
jgi:hypothetical protein